jgi:mannose-1-phosphate guanylyltransferase
MRLRPLTSAARPKPFVSFLRKRSLFQDSLARYSPFGTPLVMLDEQMRGLATAQARSCGHEAMNLMLEPTMRGTAASVLSACFYLSHKHDNPLVLVAPCDHHIKDNQALYHTITDAVHRMKPSQICLFGVTPHKANPHYGYVTHDTDGHVTHFTEKPAKKQAETLRKSPDTLWNTGIALMYAKTALDIAAHLDETMHNLVTLAVTRAGRVQNAARLNDGYYAQIPHQSFDKAILEKHNDMIIHRLNTGWQDVGTLPAYFRSAMG